MSTLISALSAATKIPGELKKLGKAEMAETVLNVSQGAYDLMSENLQLKEEISTLKEERRMLREEMEKIRNVEELKKKLVFKNDCYWDEAGFPICSACLEKPTEPAPIRMHTQGRTNGFVNCPECKNGTYSRGQASLRTEEYYSFQ